MNINSNAFVPNEYEDDLGLNHFNDLKEEDFSDIFDFENCATMSTSTLLPTRGNSSMNLDVNEEVEKLRIEEVRWFYKSGKKNKFWKPFVGSDSILIEKEWRKLSSSEYEATRVCVRGGMHEVDVVEKRCFPVYWTALNHRGEEEKTEIMRGTWFYENNFLPLPEDLANRIEVEHIERWKGVDLKNLKPVPGYKVMHCLKLQGCHVDWNNVNDVFLHSDAATYRALRNIVQRFGVSKASTTGYRLRRGYREDAMYEDCIPPVEHLIFVVHGIGAKPDRHKIVRNTNTLRACCRTTEAKYFCGLTKRIEFLPVEWRSELTLDGGVVSTITPRKAHGMRQFLNNNAMDILYYTSPLYRSEIVDGLRKEIFRLFKLFSERNPNFKGKISIFAHSLGSVIVHDIMTDWQPELLYEKYLMKQMKRNTGSMQMLLKNGQPSETVLQKEIGKIQTAKRHVLEAEEEFMPSQMSLQRRSSSVANSSFPFKVSNFFCVGSPLAIFLTLRGYSPNDGAGNQSDIIPLSNCKRIFNIFHPADPVAYRLEPLILPHFSGIAPLQIHSHAALKKTPYADLPAKVYTTANNKELQPFQNEEDEVNSSDSEMEEHEEVQYHGVVESSEAVNETEKPVEDLSPDAEQKDIEDKSTASGSYLSAIGRVGKNLWSRRRTSSTEKEDDVLDTSKATSLSDRSNSSSPLPNSPNTTKIRRRKKVVETKEVSVISVNLDHRIDYEMIEGFTESRLGYASLTSHTSYWNNEDVALFVLMQVHPHTALVPSSQKKNKSQ